MDRRLPARSSGAPPATGARARSRDVAGRQRRRLRTDCKVAARHRRHRFFVPGSRVGYFIATSFGQVFLTTNSLAGEPARSPAGRQRLRSAAPRSPAIRRTRTGCGPSFPGGGTSYIRRTDDGWNSELDWKIANDDRREITDRATTSTTPAARSLTAGDAGLVMLSINGADFFFEDATGTLATQDWRAVSARRRQRRRARRHERQAGRDDHRERPARHRPADRHDLAARRPRSAPARRPPSRSTPPTTAARASTRPRSAGPRAGPARADRQSRELHVPGAGLRDGHRDLRRQRGQPRRSVGERDRRRRAPTPCRSPSPAPATS